MTPQEMETLLPELCYVANTVAEPGSRIGIIKRGERGYYRTDIDNAKATLDEIKTIVPYFNGKLGVTPAQAMAMEMGSMFGWDTPGADPRHYNEAGRPNREAARRSTF